MPDRVLDLPPGSVLIGVKAQGVVLKIRKGCRVERCHFDLRGVDMGGKPIMHLREPGTIVKDCSFFTSYAIDPWHKTHP